MRSGSSELVSGLRGDCVIVFAVAVAVVVVVYTYIKVERLISVLYVCSRWLAVAGVIVADGHRAV